MNRLVLLILAIICVALPAMSQEPVDGFAARVYNQGGVTLRYRLFIPPKYKKPKPYPLILWLHGAGGSGADNLRQIQGDQVPGTHLWTTPDNVARHPAFILVPQSEGRWSDVQIVLNVIDALKTAFPIDPNRIYVLGQSIGGAAAWELVKSHPRTFAAAVFVSSAGTGPGSAKSISALPIWAFHGSNDPRILEIQKMIEDIRGEGGHPRYTEYSGMGHDIWDRVFREPGLVGWLFAQHR
ncbi:MAG TPA: PHB depolymerase family esterase [Terriglobia bacterium]|jgi:predicted peptidase